MSTHERPPTEAVLQAWVDDRLSEDERRVVHDYLAANPGTAARWRSYREQRAALRSAMLLRFPEHDVGRFRVDAVAIPGGRRPVAGRWSQAAALLVATLVGALLGGGGVASLAYVNRPLLRVVDVSPTLATDAFLAHRTYTTEPRHFVEVGASEPHLLRWLSNRLGKRLVAPDLERVGYRLIGGRLLPTLDGPAAQLMYEDGTGDRLTVYLRADPKTLDTAFRFEKREGANGFWWSEQGFAYALYGSIDQDRLLVAAQLIYEQVKS